MDEQQLIFDWNERPETAPDLKRVELDDETLRDGLQSPSVLDPPIHEKIKILHLMDRMGIHSADIGLPGAGPRAVADVRALAREIADGGMRIEANCAARTMVRDVEPIARISQEAGLPIEAATFIGSSPIRQYAEDWTLERMLRTSEEAVTFAVREGLPVMFVTEDTTRARPETLKALYENAIRWGARRICLSDTVGHATPWGVRALVRFVKEEIVTPSGEAVKVDWHGHRDRGFGLANAFAAIEAGVDRVHGTALGIGERVGNVEMDLLLVNLSLLGLHDGDLTPLGEYCQRVSDATGVAIEPGYPVFGRDAFRTGTGVHAAAIIKAEAKGDAWLADRVYSSVPASLVGRQQDIEVGPMAGLSNVKYWLRSRGFDASDEELCNRIFDYAKTQNHTLTEEEIRGLIV
ncbi:MAG: 2-isopropylmalate synthase [Gemmatimonadales bacterium]|nr:MAG: 2-isopropylmalate synthase [Gemmatimonadales bacterium]